MKYEADINRVWRSKEEYISETLPCLPNEYHLGEIYDRLPDVNISYDSAEETLRHIKRVSFLLNESAIELLRRAGRHDDSKLTHPEKDGFDKYTPKLANCTYGSQEYKSFLEGLSTSLRHHYENNTHHPEHYPNGVNGFDLFDLLEMFLDWKAATERHKDGDIYKSIELNKVRFSLSDQIVDIFVNTANNLNWDKQ